MKARLQCGFPALSFSSHILGWEAVSGEPGNDSGGTFVNVDSTKLELEKISGVDTALLVGSQVVSEMRSAIEKETGFQCSCGVAQNVSFQYVVSIVLVFPPAGEFCTFKV